MRVRRNRLTVGIAAITLAAFVGAVDSAAHADALTNLHAKLEQGSI